MADERLAVIIVAENASTSFGGEAARPLHYFRCLQNAAWTYDSSSTSATARCWNRSFPG